jgi:hypothetical protein
MTSLVLANNCHVVIGEVEHRVDQALNHDDI